VLVSSTLRDLVAGTGVTLTDRGTHTLKGIPGERPVVAVAELEPVSSAWGSRPRSLGDAPSTAIVYVASR
jgi:hypothetical protein